MYKCSDGFKKAISNYKRELKARATIDNIVIEKDILKFELEENAMSTEEFTLGGAVASTFNLEINNLHELYNNIKFEGKEVKVEVGILVGKQVEYIPMGYFIIDEVIKDRKNIKIEGSDHMLQLEVEYTPTITFPNAVDNILRDIAKQANLDYVLTNKNITVEKPLVNTLRETLRDLATICGGFARINKDKKIEIKTIDSTETEINRNAYYNLDVKEKINVNEYLIIESVFPNISKVEGFTLSYFPFVAKWQGNPCLEVGDKVTLNDNGKIYNSLILKQKFEFVGGLKVTSEASGVSDIKRKTSFGGEINKKIDNGFKSTNEVIGEKVDSSGIVNAINNSKEKELINYNRLDLKGLVQLNFKEGYSILATEGEFIFKINENNYLSMKKSGGISYYLNGKCITLINSDGTKNIN